MSKVLVFSDLHAHPFKPYSTINEDGMNSRLADTIRCLEIIVNDAGSFEVDLVLFAGDLFHERRHIVTSAFNAVWKALTKLSELEIPVIMIPGNHDQADRKGRTHALSAFSDLPNIHVVSEPGWRSVNDFDVFCLPYQEDLGDLDETITPPDPNISGEATIFLGHVGIKGADLGSNVVYKNPVEPRVKDLKPDMFDIGFLGHFHLHQDLGKNFYYVGSPLQHEWGDKGQKKGYLLWDSDSGELEQINLDAPKFMEITDESLRDGVYLRDNFCRYFLAPGEPPWDDKAIEMFKEEFGCRSLEVLPSESEGDFVERLELPPGTSYSDMTRKYVESDYSDTEGLDEEYLINIGDRLISEAIE